MVTNPNPTGGHRMTAALSLAAVIAAGTAAPDAAAVRAAVTRSVALLEKSQAEYLDQRTCFACHHQTYPTLALATARTRGVPVNGTALDEQFRLTIEHLARNRDGYKAGRGQGGQADTAGAALWTLELGAWQPDETTAAVAEYLLLRDKEQDHWRTSSNRPPSEATAVSTTYVALRGLRTFATAAQQERAKARTEAARRWLLRTKPKDTEERVFRLWGLRLAGADAADIQAAARDLLARQRWDGGWGQTDALASDAYATGTALVALHEAGGLSASDPAYRRGVGFLLRGQRADGSWLVRSRSRPFQTYFESGYPHGKDQFISITAGGWATTALALSLPKAGK
jgi:hypothetical protein